MEGGGEGGVDRLSFNQRHMWLMFLPFLLGFQLYKCSSLPVLLCLSWRGTWFFLLLKEKSVVPSFSKNIRNNSMKSMHRRWGILSQQESVSLSRYDSLSPFILPTAHSPSTSICQNLQLPRTGAGGFPSKWSSSPGWLSPTSWNMSILAKCLTL